MDSEIIKLEPASLKIEAGFTTEWGKELLLDNTKPFDKEGRSVFIRLTTNEGNPYRFYITPEALYKIIVILFKAFFKEKSNHEKVRILQSFMQEEKEDSPK